MRFWALSIGQTHVHAYTYIYIHIYHYRSNKHSWWRWFFHSHRTFSFGSDRMRPNAIIRLLLLLLFILFILTWIQYTKICICIYKNDDASKKISHVLIMHLVINVKNSIYCRNANARSSSLLLQQKQQPQQQRISASNKSHAAVTLIATTRIIIILLSLYFVHSDSDNLLLCRYVYRYFAILPFSLLHFALL